MHLPSDTAEPVAIIGIGCRLPGGVTSPEGLWQLLCDGVDAIRPVPAGRWDVDRFYSTTAQRPGRMNAREGGFLDEVDTFDATFFRISRRIAEQMDPQQRLLLETCWETLENAGVAPDQVTGSRTGVFIGACSQDYGSMQSSPTEIEGMGAHSATGTFMSILSNRLSYTLDLHGPSMTIDTACSSSLVAVHLACDSIRRGESEVALAGGVNVMLTPQFAIALSQAAMLSPDARSKAFDAAANGYVRGEGAGVVLLKPLSQAMLDRDRIYAVIRGSAVNQDGNTDGITLPNGAAQEANFRDALAVGRVAARDIGYVEAHGTGTRAGDPIEANALGRCLAGEGEREHVTLMGSIKTNIGHLEAGAGIAGLIKAALSVYHRQIPPSLHFHTPNPEIEFDRLGLAVPTATQAWPSAYERAIASVNSFGFGGTNANVVLEEPPAPVGEPAAVAPPETGTSAAAPVFAAAPAVLTLSARSKEALGVLATSYAERLERDPLDLEQLGNNLALRRSHHHHRLAVVASDAGEAAGKLRGYLDAEITPGVTANTADSAPGKLLFLFNGQGPQWYAMGRTLLETSPVYRAKILECDELARQYIDWSIYEALTAPTKEASRISETHRLQPTMFALQVGLTELWKSWGVRPDGVLGHSMGEIAAAHVCGGLSLDDALRVICHRSAIQERADATGGMMFVAVGADDALQLCARYPDDVWLSARNSPQASTLSGRRPALERLAEQLTDEGVFNRILRVNCACHSPDMDPLRDELFTAVHGLRGKPTEIPMYSTVSGARIDGEKLDDGYWWQNFRQPVLFEQGIRSALDDGFGTFVELSPHPVLMNSLKEILSETPGETFAVSSLARDKDDWSTFLGAFSALYTAGRAVDWQRRYPHRASTMDLPTNPWIRESYWNESEVSREYRAGGQSHPMLKRVDAIRPTWEIKWDDHRLNWVNEHDVFSSIIVPGAAYIEAAIVAARELTEKPVGLQFVEFERACVIPEDDPQLGRIELDPDSGSFEVHHRAVRKSAWTRNVRGRFHQSPSLSEAAPRQSTFDLGEIRSRCHTTYSAMDVYGVLRRKGYAYGPAFCGISRLHVGHREALARIDTPRMLRNRTSGYLFHPVLLDACFQTAILHPTENNPGELLPFTYLPTGIDEVRLHGTPERSMWCYTKVRKLDLTGLLVDINVLDNEGTLIAEYLGLHGKVVQQTSADNQPRIEDDFYRFDWAPSPLPDSGQPPRHSAVALSPQELAGRLEPVRMPLSLRLNRKSYATEYQRDLRELCSAYVVSCLHRFGHDLTKGETFTVNDVAGIQPRFHRVFLNYLNFLVEDGVLSERDGTFQVERHWPVDPEQLWSKALLNHPASVWELLLVHKTGSRLHEVLLGEVDPLELLFPEGAHVETEPIYESSPIARYYNLLAKNAIQELVRTADPHRTIRILEVGGGTGGLTANLLSALPADRCEYVFTDVSPAFLRTTAERFRDYPFVDYRTFDLEHSPQEQDIATGFFDLVLASDVVHATTDLKKTLLHLQETLAPGGLLVMLEAAPHNRWLDLTFGLTTGWWSFRDLALRPDGPLLTPQGWQSVLESAAYSNVTTFTDPQHDGPGSQTIVLGQAPSITPEPAGLNQKLNQQQPDEVGSWVIFAEPQDQLAAKLVEHIRDHSGQATLVHRASNPSPTEDSVRPGHLADYERVFTEYQPRGVIDLCTANPEGLAAVDSGQQTCLHMANIVQALNRTSPDASPQLCTVTRGAHAFRNDIVNLAAAPAWGFATVADLEQPQTRYTMLDLPPASTGSDVDHIWAELWARDNEREIAIRGGERFVRRLNALPATALNPAVPANTLPDDTAYILGMHTAGSLDGFHFRTTDRTTPAPGQVEIQVISSGLNFLDVMTALGQVPTLESNSEFRFGAECAGIITQVGEGVQGLRLGDAVIGVTSAQGTLASHIVLDATGVVAKPDNLSFEEAASIPIVFLTAWYALNQLARVRAGDRVLIHSAAGGTGLAALHIARLLGAEVLATAGTPEKRALLRSLGVQHVMDSRSLGFAEQVRAATGGQGVDVVLNAMAGESMPRSIDCLASFGRFVEIGKRALLEDRKLGLRPFLRNLSYFSFDLRQLIIDRPREVHTEFEKLVARFTAGELQPLPFRVFQPAHITPAFRHLSSAQHIGKLVVTMEDRDVPVQPAPRFSRNSFDGTWLLTGGLGGFGLATANALATAGVRNLVLIGRSGVSTPEAHTAVEELRAQGVQVKTEAVDITSRPQLTKLLADIADVNAEMPPLQGILHCAMVLDDALLTDLDEQRFHRVFAPKALGAWHLHELTAGLPLTAFVLFSSATAMVGNRGQANYGAANAFLDHLAQARRATGQPGLAINWGAVSDAGYVARHDDVARLVAATGLRGFSANEAFHAMTTLLAGTTPQVGVLPMDWPRFFNHYGMDTTGATAQPRYASIFAAHADAAQAEGAGAGRSLRQRLAVASAEAREPLLREELKTGLATVLGMPRDELKDDMPLMDYLDSLLTVEISSWLERELGVKVTAMELMKGLSVAQLTTQLLTRMGENQ